MTESLPSGMLKVAEEAKEHLNAAIDAARHGLAAITRREQTRLCEERIDQLAALASPPPQATGAQEWEAHMSSDGKRVVLDSADFKHDAALILNGDFESPDQRMNYARGLAAKLNALSSAKREAEPLTDAKVIAMNPYLNDEDRRALWLAAFRFAERHHGITAASQVEPEDKHG